MELRPLLLRNNSIIFNEFQFDKGNTYLLTKYWAGGVLRQLYNRFIEAIQEVDKDRKIVDVLSPKTRSQQLGSENAPVWYEFFHSVQQIAENDEALKKVREAYEEWLFRCSVDVYKATDSLRACSELLSHQLSLLYKDWFRDIKDKVSVRRQLQGYISEDAQKAIEGARFQSTLLRPMGGSLVRNTGSGGANGKDAGQPQKAPQELVSDDSRPGSVSQPLSGSEADTEATPNLVGAKHGFELSPEEKLKLIQWLSLARSIPSGAQQ